jgi:hypothetical protein
MLYQDVLYLPPLLTCLIWDPGYSIVEYSIPEKNKNTVISSGNVIFNGVIGEEWNYNPY